MLQWKEPVISSEPSVTRGDAIATVPRQQRGPGTVGATAFRESRRFGTAILQRDPTSDGVTSEMIGWRMGQYEQTAAELEPVVEHVVSLANLQPPSRDASIHDEAQARRRLVLAARGASQQTPGLLPRRELGRLARLGRDARVGRGLALTPSCSLPAKRKTWTSTGTSACFGRRTCIFGRGGRPSLRGTAHVADDRLHALDAANRTIGIDTMEVRPPLRRTRSAPPALSAGVLFAPRMTASTRGRNRGECRDA